MKKLDRYLFREIATPLVLSVALVVGLVFLLQVRRLASAALGLGVTLPDILMIFVAALPPFLVMAIPIAFLLSVLIGLGRLSHDLELTALRALGFSAWRLARVPLILGILVSLVCLPLAFYGEPFGLRLLHKTLVDLGLRNLTSAVRPGTFNQDFRGNAVYAGARSAGGKLRDVLLFDERDPEMPILVTAALGSVQTTDAAGIRLSLSNGEMHLGRTGTAAQYERAGFSSLELELDAGREILRRTRFVSVINQMTGEEMRAEVAALGPRSALGRRIEKTYWRRFAFPTMAFVFGLLAVGIALSGGPRSRSRAALLGTGAVVSYYVLTRLADLVVVRVPHSPLLASWIPNFLMLALGAWLLVRAERVR